MKIIKGLFWFLSGMIFYATIIYIINNERFYFFRTVKWFLNNYQLAEWLGSVATTLALIWTLLQTYRNERNKLIISFREYSLGFKGVIKNEGRTVNEISSLDLILKQGKEKIICNYYNNDANISFFVGASERKIWLNCSDITRKYLKTSLGHNNTKVISIGYQELLEPIIKVIEINKLKINFDNSIKIGLQVEDNEGNIFSSNFVKKSNIHFFRRKPRTNERIFFGMKRNTKGQLALMKIKLPKEVDENQDAKYELIFD